MASAEVLESEDMEGDENVKTSFEQIKDDLSAKLSAKLSNPSVSSLQISRSIYDRMNLHLHSYGGFSPNVESAVSESAMEMDKEYSHSKTSSSLGICGHGSGGDTTDSICHYGSRVENVDAFGDGTTQPRPYTDLIDKTFPDHLLAKACAEIARKRPDSPIRYLAFFLMNHAENQERDRQYAALLRDMMDYKKTLEVPDAESYLEEENLNSAEEGSVAEELNYELETESIPHHTL